MSIKEMAVAFGWEVYKAEFLNPHETLESQTDQLYEDMCWVYKQVNPELNIAIDIGWYGESYSVNGLFKLYVLKNNDWDSPVFVYSSTKASEIILMFEGLIKIMDVVNN